MPPILDVTIGLFFVYLLFSLVLSAARELIAAFCFSSWDKRARLLKEGLGELLREPGAAAGIAKSFYDHPFIRALSPDRKNALPNYIPREAFVGTMLDLLAPANAAAARTAADVVAGINGASVNAELRRTLLALFEESGRDLEAFKGQLGAWFDRSMERVSGWYKKYTQLFIFFLGLVLAGACNVDSLRIVDALSTDAKLREQIVASATQAVTRAAAEKGGAQAADEVTKLKDVVREMNGYGLPIGWRSSDVVRAQSILGWLLTALAASLGAPFWFDLLNRLVTIRAGGRAPEEVERQKKKDS